MSVLLPTKVIIAQDFADPATYCPLQNAHHHSIWSWKSPIKLENRIGKSISFPSTTQTGCFLYQDTRNSQAPWNRHIHLIAATNSNPSVGSPSRHQLKKTGKHCVRQQKLRVATPFSSQGSKQSKRKCATTTVKSEGEHSPKSLSFHSQHSCW